MKELVCRMFDTIDHERWHELPTYFDDAIIYRRPGFPEISGIEDLCNFYHRVRPIREGRHTIELLVEEKEHLAAFGSFEGALKDGRLTSVRFSDLYRLRDSKIYQRRTYFYEPSI